MLQTIKAALGKSPQGIQVGFSRIDGGGGTGVLIAADDVGVVITVGHDTYCYPWTGVQRIRIP